MDGLAVQVAGWAATSVIGALVGAVVASCKRRSAKGDAMEQGMRALMRRELITLHKDYVIDLGYCPVIIKDHAGQVYKAYHTLGGNGTGTALYEEILECHVEDDEKAGGTE